MKEQLISFETAKLAKEKGFNIPSNKMYAIGKDKYMLTSNRVPLKNVTHAPTQSLLQKWLREEHHIDITVIINWIDGNRIYYVGLSYINSENEIDIWFSIDGTKNKSKIEYKTYEEALEVGLQEAVNTIKLD